MKRYTGLECVYCHEKFQDDDDVVVCPDCGAPHHRDCYKKTGHCAREDKHGTGDVWQPPSPTPAQNQNQEIVCPNCKAPNPKQSQYCQMCGIKLSTGEQTRRDAPPMNEGGFTPPPGTVYIGNVDNTDQWEIGGITAHEISAYIGGNSIYYLRQFRMMQTSSTQWSWNWAAFIFGPFYFFYRKLYKVGIALLLLHILLSVPLFVYYFEFLKANASIFGGTNMPYNQNLYNSMISLMHYTQFLTYVLMGFSALYANRLYMKKALGDIKIIKQTIHDNAGRREYFTNLYISGRPNRIIVLVVGFLLINVFFWVMQYMMRYVNILPPTTYTAAVDIWNLFS